MRKNLALTITLLLIITVTAGCALGSQANEAVSVPTVEAATLVPTYTPQPTATIAVPSPPATVKPSLTPTLAPTTAPENDGIIQGNDAEPEFTAQGLRLPVPIFGEGEYLVAIDPGHGGIDEGTYPYNPEGTLDYSEAKVTLQIAFRLRDILVANHIRVFLTRDGDYMNNENWLDINGDGLQDIGDETQARVDMVNTQGADLFFAIHLNARTYNDGSVDPNYNGATTYYCSDRPQAYESLRLAELVHAQVLQALTGYGYEPFDQGVIDDINIDDFEPRLHLIMLGPQTDRIARPSLMPAALDEPLFATHYTESELAARPEVWDVLAGAYARAIMLYLQELVR
jgi:N-acetylmuramoyl-L-alanine amidase